MSFDRRDFVKVTTAGVTGLILGGKATRAYGAWPDSGTLAINPNISNMRVVGCVDPTMMKSKPTSMTFAAQNAVVDAARVAANMDAMAMQLAKTSTADAAWSAIFRSSKPWASTIAAIKVNTVESKNMAHIAIIQKFVAVLTKLGVPPKNIIVYDGNENYAAAISNYTSHFSLTDAAKISAVVSNVNSALGGAVSAPLPGGSSAKCTAHIANGTVDILINIANNKGHTLFAGSTLCMKNHFGTFAPNHTNLASYVFKINKSDAIVGGSPARQQLCLVDSLFANKAANTGTPEVMPGYLVMGTFAPAVDYLTVKKVREEVMGCKHDAATVKSFLTSFSYTTNDPEWVLVPPAGSAAIDSGTDAPARDAGSADVPARDEGGSGGPARDAGVGTRGDGGAGTGGKGGSTEGGAGEAGGGGDEADDDGPTSPGVGCEAPGGSRGVGISALALVSAQLRRLLVARKTLGERKSGEGEDGKDGEEGKTDDRG